MAKHYADELATGADLANGVVAGKLYAQASSDGKDMPTTVARMFWLKTRARWRETSGIVHEGADGEPFKPSAPVQIYLPDNGRDPLPLTIEGRAIKPAKMIERVKVAQ